MRFFNKKQSASAALSPLSSRNLSHPFSELDRYIPLSSPRNRLYDAMKEALPILSAAIEKIVRLTVGCSIKCGSKETEAELGDFLDNLRVGASSRGIDGFLSIYLDSLLTYGNAVGEILLTSQLDDIYGIYIAPLDSVELRRGETPLQTVIAARDELGRIHLPQVPELLFHTALNPLPGEVVGNSILKSLPFVSSVLVKIFNAVGNNWDRAGNARFAVTYKPRNDAMDKAMVKERAAMIANEWSRVMSSERVRDFITVGDVDIRVIGADNQILDSAIPVKQLMEQIIAKLGVPPFLLGLNWSSTEGMSKQQCDMLTSELEFYRRILTPVILKICRLWLRLKGRNDEPEVCWQPINLQDEVEEARVRLIEAQASRLSQE